MTKQSKMNRRYFLLATTSASIALASSFGISRAAPSGVILPSLREARPRLTSFRLGQVRLGEGPFRDAETWNRAFMLRIAPDRLLHTFRLNAGLPTTAQPLGGWEAPDCELRGHFTGHYLSACALGFASRNDSELKTCGDYLVKSLAECQAALNQKGYLSAFPQSLFVRLDARQQVWVPIPR